MIQPAVNKGQAVVVSGHCLSPIDG
jgi:hypothetical protein